MKKGVVILIVSAIRVALLSVAVSFAYMSVRWLVSGMNLSLDKITGHFKIAFIVSYAVLLLLTIIYVISLRLSSIFKDIDKNGYTDENLTMLRRLSQRKHGIFDKSVRTIIFIETLIDAKRYDEAKDELLNIELSDLSERELVSFYNDYMYVLLCEGKTADAEQVLLAGKKVIDKYQLRGSIGMAIGHTLALLEYQRGNISMAESKLNQVKAIAKQDGVIVACNILMLIIYLKTNRNSDAKMLAEQTAMMKCSRGDRQTLDKIMRCIEQSFGVKREQETV